MTLIIKSFAVTLLSFFTFCAAYAQHQVSIRLNPKTEAVDIDGVTLDGKATNDMIVKAMGKPSKTVDHPNGEVSLFYEEAGIVFFTKDNVVKGLDVNFNTDGDKKFPATSLNGTLRIGETEITKESKQEDIVNIKDIEFICPFALLCASANRDSKTKTTAAFQDGTLTQMVFLTDNK